MDISAPCGTLMVLDDDTLFVEKLTRMLRKSEWTVLGFHDPDQALAYLLKHGLPNVFLVDSHMPQIDGLAFLAKLGKLIPNTANSAVLISEMKLQTSVQEQVEALGFDFITKDRLRNPDVLHALLLDHEDSSGPVMTTHS